MFVGHLFTFFYHFKYYFKYRDTVLYHDIFGSNTQYYFLNVILYIYFNSVHMYIL